MERAASEAGEIGGMASLARVLGHYWAAMAAAEAGVFEDNDPEALHDFRVALRRTRSLLKTLGHVVQPVAFKRFRRDFSWLAKATGPNRDLDVSLSQFDAQRRSLKLDSQTLVVLRRVLARRRALARSRLLRVLRSNRYDNLKFEWPQFLEAAREETTRPPSARDASGGAIQRAYNQVCRQSATIRPRSKIERLHELRKDCKELRYLIEAFANLFDSDRVARLVRSLRQLQDALGRVCDLAVQEALLGELAEDLPPEPAAAPARAAVRLWRQTLRKRQGEAREKINVPLDRFMRKRNRRWFKSLFGEGAM
ncbi:MAG: CHAD domain-containing protein [Chromatiales bacterium]